MNDMPNWLAGGSFILLLMATMYLAKLVEAVDKLNKNLSGLRMQIEDMGNRQSTMASDLYGLKHVANHIARDRANTQFVNVVDEMSEALTRSRDTDA